MCLACRNATRLNAASAIGAIRADSRTGRGARRDAAAAAVAAAAAAACATPSKTVTARTVTRVDSRTIRTRRRLVRALAVPLASATPSPKETAPAAIRADFRTTRSPSRVRARPRSPRRDYCLIDRFYSTILVSSCSYFYQTKTKKPSPFARAASRPDASRRRARVARANASSDATRTRRDHTERDRDRRRAAPRAARDTARATERDDGARCRRRDAKDGRARDVRVENVRVTRDRRRAALSARTAGRGRCGYTVARGHRALESADIAVMNSSKSMTPSPLASAVAMSSVTSPRFARSTGDIVSSALWNSSAVMEPSWSASK